MRMHTLEAKWLLPSADGLPKAYHGLSLRLSHSALAFFCAVEVKVRLFRSRKVLRAAVAIRAVASPSRVSTSTPSALKVGVSGRAAGSNSSSCDRRPLSNSKMYLERRYGALGSLPLSGWASMRGSCQEEMPSSEFTKYL